MDNGEKLGANWNVWVEHEDELKMKTDREHYIDRINKKEKQDQDNFKELLRDLPAAIENVSSAVVKWCGEFADAQFDYKGSLPKYVKSAIITQLKDADYENPEHGNSPIDRQDPEASAKAIIAGVVEALKTNHRMKSSTGNVVAAYERNFANFADSKDKEQEMRSL